MDFYELTSQMRQAQKDYFKTRTPSDLSRAKELERKVDAEIARMMGKTPQQRQEYMQTALFI